MKTDHTSITETYRSYIESYFEEKCFVYDAEPQETLFDAMRYSLLAGGKRLRPIFVFEFCRMCGGDWYSAVNFAAAVEMIHTYSLIHDDLPCMDNDDYRRGRLTNHKVFGEAVAVLAGDGLLTAAFHQLSTADLPADARIKAVEVLSQCAGECGMVGGQVLDMQSEQRQCTQQEVLDIQSRKTGALIRAACMLGVIAAGGSAEQLKAAADFAANLGLSFQIRDDMLDVIGNAKELGKAVGVDENKNTFVQLYGLKKCDELVRTYTESAICALSAFTEPDYMAHMARSLTERTV
ncbi:MAG: polyprenyl synthetase family protein [Oscillospiraceae bacterium]|nr:polyprenyl synthetase family protein [Oscillospiraceae bacterium]